VHLLGHCLAFDIGERVALDQRLQIRSQDISTNLPEERFKRCWLVRQYFVVPRDGSEAWQKMGVRSVVPRDIGGDTLKVGGLDQDDAVEVDRVAIAQVLDDRRAACRSVALAQYILRAAQASVVIQVLRYEATDRVDIRTVAV